MADVSHIGILNKASEKTDIWDSNRRKIKIRISKRCAVKKEEEEEVKLGTRKKRQRKKRRNKERGKKKEAMGEKGEDTEEI